MDTGARSGAARRQDTGVIAWMRLARVFQKIDQHTAEHLRRWKLSVAQFDALARVGAAPGVTQQALADSLLVTKGNVCQLIDRMEHNGLVERRQDGRANRLYLTPKGQRLFDEAVPAQEALIADRFAALSVDEQAELSRLLRKLERAVAPAG